jgi:hypothetical protein
MNLRTLEAIIRWIEKGQISAHEPLFLTLFGEPLLFGKFVEYARRLKEVAPLISFSTNGTHLTGKLADEIASVGFAWVTVSPHDKMAATWASRLLMERGVNVTLHKGPDHNWAGQVKREADWSAPCEFAADDMVVVHWDGDVAVCCVLDNKNGVIGTVFDEDLPEKLHRPTSFCEACHLQYLRKGEKANGERETDKKDSAENAALYVPEPGVSREPVGMRGLGENPPA